MLPEQKPNESHDTEPQPAGRPEWMPEKYWNEESGEANIRGIVDALTGTQTALRNKKDEMREELLEEIKGTLPKSAEDYTIDYEKMGVEGADKIQLSEEDPLVKMAKDWALEAGVKAEDFNKLLGVYAKSMIDSSPNKENEMKALGENGEARVERLSRLADKALSTQEEWNEFALMAQTAKGIEVLEKLLDSKPASGPQEFNADPATIFNAQNELDKLMSSDAYWNRDRATLAKVDQLQQRLARSRR